MYLFGTEQQNRHDDCKSEIYCADSLAKTIQLQCIQHYSYELDHFLDQMFEVMKCEHLH